MNNELRAVINEIKDHWDSMTIESIEKIKTLISQFAKNGLEEKNETMFDGLELYRDEKTGFIIFAYAEKKETYRIPHNHGNGWVIYAVIEGEVKMGSYFNWTKSNGQSNLILKNVNILKAGDVEIYFPGDIHDTRCLSERAVILRLTSCDLKVEEKEGRMQRF